MKLNSYLRKFATTVLLAAFSMVSIQMPAMADIVSTDQIATEQRSQDQRDAVRSFLDRADVQAQLEARGVDAADALKRFRVGIPIRANRYFTSG